MTDEHGVRPHALRRTAGPPPAPGRWRGPLLGAWRRAPLGRRLRRHLEQDAAARASRRPTFQVDKDTVKLIASAGADALRDGAWSSPGRRCRARRSPRASRRSSRSPRRASRRSTAASSRCAVRIGDHVKEGDQLVMVRERRSRLARARAERGAASPSRRRRRSRSACSSSSSRAPPRRTISWSRRASSTRRSSPRAAADAKLRSLTRARRTATRRYWILAARAGTVVQLDARARQAGRPRQGQAGGDRRRPRRGAGRRRRAAARRRRRSRSASSRRRSPSRAAARSRSRAPVELVSDVLDPERQTVPIRVRVKNPRARPAAEPVRRGHLRDPRAPTACSSVPSEAVVTRRREERRVRRDRAGRAQAARGAARPPDEGQGRDRLRARRGRARRRQGRAAAAQRASTARAEPCSSASSPHAFERGSR